MILFQLSNDLFFLYQAWERGTTTLQVAHTKVIRDEPLRLNVSLFGSFKLCDINGAEIVITNRRARTILAMLCLVPDEPIDRELISKLLWPGRFPAQARASLRQCLLNLGKLLDASGTDILDVSRSQVRLKPAGLQTDLITLEKALAEQDYVNASEQLMGIGGKPLLDQMQFGDLFQDWLNEKRRHIEARLEKTVLASLSDLEQSNTLADHARLLTAWKLRTPENSIKSRNKDQAVRLAVLPFRSLVEPDDQGFLADGIVDELITTLGQVPQLRVAGRSSSFRFKNANSPVSEIAKRLNVSHLLEGTVHRHEDQLRISVSLIDAASGFEVWSDSYDGSVDDVFAAREDVARAIANGLIGSLNLAAHDLRPRTLTKNREAYGLFLQGRALTLRAVGEGVLETAKDLLTQALEIDPNFAECWAALAETHLYTAVFTPSLERSALAERMADAARKAIALNPRSGHARAMLGVYEFIKGNPVAALDLAFEAYRFEPTNVDVMVRLGSFLMYIGRTRDAMPYIKAAIERDPVHGRTYIALCAGYHCLGEYDKAIAAGERMVDLGIPGLWLAVAQAANGFHEKAVSTYYDVRALLGTVITRPPGMPPMDDAARDAYFDMAAKGVCSGKKEDRALYCQVLEGLHATMADPYDPSIAYPAIWMGHSKLAMKIYREQMTLANMFGLMTLWSDSDPIRQTRLHPDFMSFAKDIGLVAAWEKYGWPDLLPDPKTVP